MGYIWQHPAWPHFVYDEVKIAQAYGEYQYQHGAVDAVFSFFDSSVKERFQLEALAAEAVNSGEIEGESLPYDSVLSSVAKRLDIVLDIQAKDDAYARNVSQLIVDATQNASAPMTLERILLWHQLLFATPKGFAPKHVGAWRTAPIYVMKNRRYGEGDILYEGVPASQVEPDMTALLAWINDANELRPLVKSAIVSLWFVVIHPFDDGNGRISRALADYVLARGEHQQFRYLSLSKKILDERVEYYARLQEVSGQRDSVDITEWLLWYVRMAIRVLGQTLELFSAAIRRRRRIQFLDPSEFNARQISMLMNLSGGDSRGKLTKEKWMKMTKSTAATAIRDINALVEKHLLVRSEQGGRSTSYVLDTEALDQLCL